MKDNLVVQPSIKALIERAQANLGTNATVLFHRSGQILAKHGAMPDSDYPTIAVLVAGMVAAGQSLAELHGLPENNDFSLSHGTSDGGIYAVRVSRDFWVFSLYKKILNPGLFRMQMRRLAKEIEQHLQAPKGWLDEEMHFSPSAGAKTAPAEKSGPRLFSNITDEEIDQLFSV